MPPRQEDATCRTSIASRWDWLSSTRNSVTPGYNLERALPYIARATGQGADLVMFPELYLQG